jgi:DNA-binding PadR family transcriptional regulator
MNDAETKEPTNDGSLPPPKQLLLPSFAEIVLIVIDAAPGVTAFQISAYLELMTGCVINPKLVRSALHDLHANMLVRSNQDKTSNRRYQIQEEGLQALTYSRQLRARLKRSILRLPPPITGDRDVAGKSTRLSGGDPWIPRFRPGGGALTGNPDRPSEQSPLQSGVSPLIQQPGTHRASKPSTGLAGEPFSSESRNLSAPLGEAADREALLRIA